MSNSIHPPEDSLIELAYNETFGGEGWKEIVNQHPEWEKYPLTLRRMFARSLMRKGKEREKEREKEGEKERGRQAPKLPPSKQEMEKGRVKEIDRFLYREFMQDLGKHLTPEYGRRRGR
ncbi:MAG: hypothetical protein GTO16_05090 [Candidatus Aminicenantes bacterium]|nr:hypothetical protein [Candidatus Aminicenantes bacterium]